MKPESINTNEALPTHDFRHPRSEVKYPKHVRASLRLMSPPALTAANREYLRGLRAAEMAAWTLSGGDYLLSSAA